MANITKEIELRVMDSKIVQEIIEKDNKGYPLKKHEALWFNNLKDVRKVGVRYAMTPLEETEWIRCKLDVHYFAENYCKIKREDGTIGAMKLREYQKDIVDLYTNNRYSILMASRQTGKCVNFDTNITIKDVSNYIRTVPIGLYYFEELKKFRSLTILEKIKYNLFKLYIWLDHK